MAPGRPGGAGGPTQSGAGGASSGDELRFNVYWASSRIMRAASARKSVLHGEKKDVDVAKYATEPQEEYQIVVQSEDMSPFVRHDESFYQANSFLDVKKTRQKISPSHERMRLRTLVSTWQEQAPKAVATLQRDFEQTIVISALGGIAGELVRKREVESGRSVTEVFGLQAKLARWETK